MGVRSELAASGSHRNGGTAAAKGFEGNGADGDLIPVIDDPLDPDDLDHLGDLGGDGDDTDGPEIAQRQHGWLSIREFYLLRRAQVAARQFLEHARKRKGAAEEEERDRIPDEEWRRMADEALGIAPAPQLDPAKEEGCRQCRREGFAGFASGIDGLGQIHSLEEALGKEVELARAQLDRVHLAGKALAQFAMQINRGARA